MFKQRALTNLNRVKGYEDIQKAGLHSSRGWLAAPKHEALPTAAAFIWPMAVAFPRAGSIPLPNFLAPAFVWAEAAGPKVLNGGACHD
jgi:hypothetical protein